MRQSYDSDFQLDGVRFGRVKQETEQGKQKS
jgi:hypothetical protein